MKKNGLSSIAKSHGVTVAQVILVSGQSRQTLQNWAIAKPGLVAVVAAGVRATSGANSALGSPRDYYKLLSELYQVLGALDASSEVLDQVSAAIGGKPLPHETLLPYFE